MFKNLSSKAVYNVFLCLLASLILSGCSVGMAMSGKKEPNLSVVQVGADRGVVEIQLGTPTAIASMDNNQTMATYEYELGNEPSAGRAAFHGTMDVLTLGLWEIAGTPIEGFTGEKKNLVIFYDNQNKVVSINSMAPIKPAEKLAQEQTTTLPN